MKWLVLSLLLAGADLTDAASEPARSVLSTAPRDESRPVWPGAQWAAATPESQGLSSARLEAAAAYALKHGGGSGCVVRHGYLLTEWGSPSTLADIKSATKGSVGTTMLGLAVDNSLLQLDDLAQKHYPAIGAEHAENAVTGWLREITVRHLATMTAGFDDGRPPHLVRRPGSGGEYSNDTSNMLAELLTLLFKEDLATVFKRRVMDPIAAPPNEWKWRANSFRAKTVGGLPSREFASGITITHRALARLGYLYLRGGEWNGRRILSRGFIREATTPTGLPAPFGYYAFYWGSNARGTYAAMPRDAFWALGLGDSFVIVCPSLDLVAVRLGVGSNQSRLPGDSNDSNWGQRVEGFFSLVVQSVREAPGKSGRVIERIEWAPASTILRLAKDSDNWPMTWADDDWLYTAYGDGTGFAPKRPEKLSLGLARLRGIPPDIHGENLRAPSLEQKGDGPRGPKASGLLCVDGLLYLWARNAGHAQLAWSADHGATWTWCDWKFTNSFGCPTFVNFRKNNAGARDQFVYVVSPDRESAYLVADQFVLARVPTGEIRNRSAYEFFKQLDAAGQPVWTKDARERGGVLENPGRCYRCGVSYNAALKRYLLGHAAPVEKPRRGGRLAIYEAPEPWGPWTTVFNTDLWDVDPGESCSFPTKWMSADGLTVWLVFSGDDSFSARRATLQLR